MKNIQGLVPGAIGLIVALAWSNGCGGDSPAATPSEPTFEAPKAVEPEPESVPAGHHEQPSELFTPRRSVSEGAVMPMLPIDLPWWLSDAQAVAVGGAFEVANDNPIAQYTLNALGFSRKDPRCYRREANLMQRHHLVPSNMEQLPEIDTIAMISIYRPNMDVQYIYPTLRRFFAEFPPTAHVNVLVGNADSAYLQANILKDELGASQAERVHVVCAPADIASFFDREQTSLKARATWNYARALRSYNGNKKFLLLEDDVSWSPNSVTNLSAWLDAMPVDAMTLFNDRCLDPPDIWRRDGSLLALQPVRLRKNTDFPTTQAIVFDAASANAAGTYLLQRAGRESYDYMLGRFFSQCVSTLGYIYPSIVQHEGRKTTGLSGPNSVPYSQCMYKPIEDEDPLRIDFR